MRKKEVEEIIKSYKPHKGFFDLSLQPKEISDIEYAKILKTQNFLAMMNKNRKYEMEFNPTQWDKLKELSGQLQAIIFEHWGSNVFN